MNQHMKIHGNALQRKQSKIFQQQIWNPKVSSDSMYVVAFATFYGNSKMIFVFLPSALLGESYPGVSGPQSRAAGRPG